MTRDYRHLLAPGRIGKLELRNRMIMTAMGTMLAEPGGFCGDRLRAYYAERARGGIGLIVMGSHGHGALRTLTLGSFADLVLRNTRVPVTVVR